MTDCNHDYKLDFKSSIYICAHCGKGRITEPKVVTDTHTFTPEGYTIADVKVLRRANHAFAIENYKLREAGKLALKTLERIAVLVPRDDPQAGDAITALRSALAGHGLGGEQR